MLYIDFDGVILDTAPLLFDDWINNPHRHLLTEEDKIRYIQSSNWHYIINNSLVINDAIYYLNNISPIKSSILTKIHSQQEGIEKVIWLREKGIKQSIILVPYRLKKVDMVSAKDNILVDDCLQKLREWQQCGGEPILFDIDDDGYDSWQQPNKENYPKVLNLSKFK